jgi:outer membrane receptor protein involved in Fe transport
MKRLPAVILLKFLAVNLISIDVTIAQLPIEEVSVIAERIENNEQSVWSVSVFDAKTLQKNPTEHIQQLLNTVPGVNLQRGNGMEYLPALRSPVLTGAGACGNLLIMEEGIRLRGAGTCNVNELFDAHHEQAQQIEVLRGPVSAFHGANALLGAIDIRLGVVEESRLSLDASNLCFSRVRFRTHYGEEQQKGSVFFTFTDDSGWRDQSGLAQQKFSWRHEMTVNDWQLKPGLTFVNLNQETAGFIVGKDAYKDSELAETNPAPEAYRDNKAGRLWLHARYKFSDESELLITPYMRHTDMSFLQHFLPGDPLEENRQNGFGLQASVYQQVSPLWQINYGSDFEYSETSLQQSQENPTQGSAFLMETIPQGDHYDYDADVSSAAAFIQARGAVNDSWNISAGLRVETIQYNYKNHLSAGRTRADGSECGFGGCRYSRPESGKDHFTHWSPNIGATVDLGGLTFFANAGKSFRPPQTSELYRLQRAQSKADLDNVEAININAGFEFSTKNSSFRFEAYDNKLKNLIIRDVNFFNVDNARSDSTGLEATWLQTVGRWQSRLTLNWARHRYGSNQFLGVDDDSNPIDVSGNHVDTAPAVFGNWQLQWQPQESISTTIAVDYTDKYYLEPLNEHEYEGHAIWYWNTAWAINERVNLRLKVNNVFGKRYATRADFTGFSGYRYFPGEPRAFVLGVDIRL